MKKIQILSIIVVALASGCATKKVHVSEMFVPIEFVTKPLPEYNGMPHGEVFAINGKKESLEFIKNPMDRGELRDVILGHLFFGGEPVTPGIARVVAAACGGDKYIAANLGESKDRLNFMWVKASPSLTRELLAKGFLSLPQPKEVKSNNSEKNKSLNNRSLLLNDSSL